MKQHSSRRDSCGAGHGRNLPKCPFSSIYGLSPLSLRRRRRGQQQHYQGQDGSFHGYQYRFNRGRRIRRPQAEFCQSVTPKCPKFMDGLIDERAVRWIVDCGVVVGCDAFLLAESRHRVSHLLKVPHSLRKSSFQESSAASSTLSKALRLAISEAMSNFPSSNFRNWSAIDRYCRLSYCNVHSSTMPPPLSFDKSTGDGHDLSSRRISYDRNIIDGIVKCGCSGIFPDYLSSVADRIFDNGGWYTVGLHSVNCMSMKPRPPTVVAGFPSTDPKGEPQRPTGVDAPVSTGATKHSAHFPAKPRRNPVAFLGLGRRQPSRCLCSGNFRPDAGSAKKCRRRRRGSGHQQQHAQRQDGSFHGSHYTRRWPSRLNRLLPARSFRHQPGQDPQAA